MLKMNERITEPQIDVKYTTIQKDREDGDIKDTCIKTKRGQHLDGENT